MSEPYGPTFPSPAFMAPREPNEKPGVVERVRQGVLVVAPVAALFMMVGVLAVVMYRGEHSHSVDSDKDQRAQVSTSASIVPALPVERAS
ncbi:hypothetical protein VMT65_23460 [Nocardia sp. CDC153]|uniref:hypothetical protein n=1 Tax=Nocardia sp. CDC153 TaxID=3112167 RepID=UPI002DBF85D8|nr:hypothetical protein [Nocardia sp. CDC153]MEC3956013.1 hypothetical protein [Nocardia sp. CDC153]